MYRYFFKTLLAYGMVLTAFLEANKTWDGNGTIPTNYGAADNWVENSLPTPTDIALFPNATNTNPTINSISAGSAYGVLGLDFTTTANQYVFTIDSNFKTLNVGNSGIANSGGQTHTFVVSDTGRLNSRGPVNSSGFTFNISQGTVSFFDGGSFSNGLFNITNLGALNFEGNSSCLSGTFNVGPTEQVAFSDFSTLSGGTFNLLSNLTDGGSLLLEIDGTIGSGVLINTSAHSTVHVTGINDLIFNGVLEGVSGGSLIFDGTGNITFASDSSGYLGGTVLEAGPKLIFTGSLGGDFVGQSDSRIEGSGTFGSDVDIFGTIAPKLNGLASTITVDGNLSIVNGLYEPLIDVNRNHSLVTASTTTLNNADLNVLVESLTGVIPARYPILSSPIIIGSFQTVTSNLNNPLVSLRQVSTPSVIYVELFVPDVIFVTNKNELSVLNALTTIIDPTADQLNVLNNLDSLAGNRFAEALDQISGEQYTNYAEVAYNATNRFSNRLRMAMRSRVNCPVCCANTNLFGWVDAGGGHSDYKGDSWADGLDNDYYSIAAGIQTLNNHGVTLGLAAYYENDDLDFDLNSSSKVNNYQAALYTAYQKGPGYILGNFIYGASQFKMKRDIIFADINRRAKSNAKLYSGTFYGEGGITNHIGCLSTQQYVGLNLGYFYQNKIRESGADSLDLRIEGSKNYRYDFVLGSRFQLNLPCSFSLELDIDYRHRFNSNRVSLEANFVDVAQEMKIRGFKLAKNGVEGSLILVGNVSGSLQWYLKAAGEAWSQYRDYSGTTGFIFHW